MGKAKKGSLHPKEEGDKGLSRERAYGEMCWSSGRVTCVEGTRSWDQNLAGSRHQSILYILVCELHLIAEQ